jgi:hypothetical protein
MSVSVLLNSETKNEQWSHLYAYEVETANLVVDNTITVEDLNVTNLTVSGEAIISGVNFASIGGIGLDNQVLESNGDGTVKWVTSGVGTGNVIGPTPPTVAGDIATYADATGLLLADTGVNIANIVTNPLSADLNCNDHNINNIKSVDLEDQGLLPAPPVSGVNLASSGSQLYVGSSVPSSASRLVAVQTLPATFSQLTVDDAKASPTLVNLNYNGATKFIESIGPTTFDLNDNIPNNYIHIDSSIPLIALGNNSNPAINLYSNAVSMGLGAHGFEIDAGTYNSANTGYVLTQTAPGIVNFASLPDSAENGIIYRPGGVSADNVYATWPEVVTACNNSNECLIVYVDDSIVSPAMITSNLDCKGRVEFRPATQSINATVKFEFMQDIQLTDPSFSGVMVVGGNTNLNSNIVLSNSYLMFMVHGTMFQNTVGSLLPIIDIPDGNGNVIGFNLGSSMSTNNAIPLINVGSGSTLILAQYSMSVPFGNNVISSTDGTAQLILEYDSTGNSVLVNPGYTGSTVLNPVSKAISTNYNDTTVPSVSIGTNLQSGLDYFKTKGKSISLEYTGTISVGQFLNAAGNPVNTGQGAQSPLTDETVAANSNINIFAYNTSTGDGTSQLQIYKNGVGQGLFLLSGVSGVVSLSISCSAGDLLGIKQEAGTNIGLCNVSLLLITN